MKILLSKDTTGKFRQRIQIGAHTLFADASEENSAPDPHELYDAALAACKAITVMMYAEHKQIPLESVDIEMESDNSRERQGEYELHAKLKFNGNLTDEQKQRLLQIADKCPVHKLMTQVKTLVHSELVQS
jgi:putative redox protein